MTIIDSAMRVASCAVVVAPGVVLVPTTAHADNTRLNKAVVMNVYTISTKPAAPTTW
jgi:hypothetical protein